MRLWLRFIAVTRRVSNYTKMTYRELWLVGLRFEITKRPEMTVHWFFFFFSECTQIIGEFFQALYGAKVKPEYDEDDDNFGAGSGKPTSTVKPPITTTNPTTMVPTAPPPRPTEGDPLLCRDGSIDAIFNSKEGVTYVFKGKCLRSIIDLA